MDVVRRTRPLVIADAGSGNGLYTLELASKGYMVHVFEIDHPKASRVAKYAAEIDNLVEKKLKTAGKSPNEIITDERFLRRTYLSIAGRIPRIAEAESFFASRYKNKRKKLSLFNAHAAFYIQKSTQKQTQKNLSF